MRDSSTHSKFGALLRHWRHRRGLSQFDLAEEAGVSTRHLSFLETSRSRPSRAMAELLAVALKLPAAVFDDWLVAAGFAPTKARETELQDVLALNERIPAFAFDGAWNIRRRNVAAEQLFSGFRRHFSLPANLSGNVLHIVCHPGGLRQFMPHWAEDAGPFAREIGRQYGSYDLYPEAADAAQRTRGSDPLMLRLKYDGRSLAFYSVFSRFAAAEDDLTTEHLYPADAVTRQAIAALPLT